MSASSLYYLPREPEPRAIQWEVVAGWTVGFSVHLAALMLLMVPLSLPPTTSTYEPPKMIVDFWDPTEVKLPPLPPEIKKEEVKKITTVKPTEKQIPVAKPDKTVAVNTVSQDNLSDLGQLATLSTEENTGVSTTDDVSSGGEVPSELISLVAIRSSSPTYPQKSVRARQEGTVLLRISIDASGVPQSVSVEKSSGHRELDQAALSHVKKTWRFSPTGKTEIGLLPISFELKS